MRVHSASLIFLLCLGPENLCLAALDIHCTLPQLHTFPKVKKSPNKKLPRID